MNNNLLQPKYGLTASNSMVFGLSTGTVSAQLLSTIRQEANVKAAFPNYHMTLMGTPNDAYVGQQWNLQSLKLVGSVQSAWDVTHGSSSIVVGVIDSGIDSANPDLTGKIDSMADCSTGTCTTVSSMTDSLTEPHGTHVSGLIGAATNNGQGIASTGFDTKVMMVKVADAGGQIMISNVINGIKWAADHGAKVINMSLGQLADNLDANAISQINDAISYAWGKGIVLVASAGNCGGNTNGDNSCALTDAQGNPTGQFLINKKVYPAASPNVISVAAITRDGTLASYSEHNDSTDSSIGNWIDVVAPGGLCSSQNDAQNCILSTFYSTQGDYGYMAGTSMASPQVAGIAALLFAVNPHLTNSQIKEMIDSTADKTVASGASVNGEVNALSAVNAAGAAVTPGEPTVTPGGPSPTINDTPTPTETISTTPEATPSPTIFSTPTPSPYPTVPPKLPHTFPSPFPSGPYCPATTNCSHKEVGDANCDGVVDNSDFKLWWEEFDTMPPATPANQNANFACVEGNKNSYFADLVSFEIWRRNTISGLTSTASGNNTNQ